MPRLHSVLAALVGVFLLLLSSRSAAARPEVDLYTIGPGDYLFARFGHSVLCVGAAGSAKRCFDYGIPDREGLAMVWATLRGRATFVPVTVDEEVMLAAFRGEGRGIERQRIALGETEATRLEALLDRDVRERRAYAYHPFFANCTTLLRDRLDEASGGRLRPGKNAAVTPRFRDFAEEGLSGRLGELAGLAVALGGPAERRPTPWERMFLPAELRDGVSARLAAPAERVAETLSVTLETSPAAGRGALVIAAVLLFALVRTGPARTSTELSRGVRARLAAVGVVLGGLAVALELLALLAVWPELRGSWVLLALWPTDLALPFMPPRALRRYALGRVAVACGVAGLEVIGVVAQPFLPVAILVALPMAAVASAVNALEGATSARRREPGAATVASP